MKAGQTTFNWMESRWFPSGSARRSRQPASTSCRCPRTTVTERKQEQALHYAKTKGERSVFYATDGAWLLYEAIRLIRERRFAFDALIIDATIGDGQEGDYRVFEHNSLPMIRMIVNTLHATGVLRPQAPVCLTHLARTLHPSQAELEAANPAPYVVTKDGLRISLPSNQFHNI